MGELEIPEGEGVPRMGVLEDPGAVINALTSLKARFKEVVATATELAAVIERNTGCEVEESAVVEAVREIACRRIFTTGVTSPHAMTMKDLEDQLTVSPEDYEPFLSFLVEESGDMIETMEWTESLRAFAGKSDRSGDRPEGDELVISALKSIAQLDMKPKSRVLRELEAINWKDFSADELEKLKKVARKVMIARRLAERAGLIDEDGLNLKER